MSRSVPREVLYILDYEDYLNHDTRMPATTQAWVDSHKDQIDTQAKRDQMIKKLRQKPKLKPQTPHQRKQMLASEFEFRYEQLTELNGSKRNIRNLCRRFHKKGVPYVVIARITGITVYFLKKWGV